MDLQEIRQKAREKAQGICRGCRVCDGRACAGEMPGMGGRGTGQSFINNVQAFREARLNLKTLHQARDPDLTLDFWGWKMAGPVMGAPMCGTKANFRGLVEEGEFIGAQLRGARRSGLVGWTGDGPQPELMDLGLEFTRDLGGACVPVVKPRPAREILAFGERAARAGAPALAVDVDAAAFYNMRKVGTEVGPKTAEQWGELAEKCPLPLILKGIMSPEEARLAAGAGVAGIVVSNHGGRALDDTPGTLEVLPGIASAAGNAVRIWMDGGVRTGYDVIKALALGAEAVLVGRPLATAALGGGEEGVSLQLEQMLGELRASMVLTGCSDLQEIGPHVLYGDGAS